MRIATAGDIPQLKALWAACFDDNEAYISYFMREKARLDHVLLEERDGQVVSALYIVDKTVHMRGVDQKTAYIVGVATLPNYRRQGLADGLLRACLLRLYKEGYAMAHLHPFSHAYYRKFGFETVCREREIRFAAHAIPQPPAGLCVEQGYHPGMTDVYQEAMQNRNGYVVRSSMQSYAEEQQTDGYSWYVRDGEKVCGYAFADCSGTTLDVTELVCSPGPYAHALLYHAAVCCPFAEQVRVTALPEQSFSFLPHSEMVQDYAMMRIVNPMRLTMLTNETGETALALQDPVIPENRRTFFLGALNGRITIRPCAREGKSMTIQAFAQHVAGYHVEEHSVFSPLSNAVLDKY